MRKQLRYMNFEFDQVLQFQVKKKATTTIVIFPPVLVSGCQGPTKY